MSLRSKIALVLFLAVSVFIGGFHVLSQLTFKKRVFEFDSARASENVGRVLRALDSKFAHLDRAASDLEISLGDPETWRKDMEYPSESAGEKVHVIIAFDETGWVQAHRILDPATGEPISLRELPNEQLYGKHPFVCQLDDFGGCEWVPTRGIYLTDRAALLVSVRIVEGSDPPLKLAVGRFLDNEVLDELRDLSGVDVEVIKAMGTNLPAHQQEVLAMAARTTEPVVEKVDGRLQAWAVVPDLRDNTALLLRCDAPDDLSGLWGAMSRDSLISTIAVAVLFPFMILLLLQFIVTGPLSRLTSHVTNIGQSSDSDARLDMQRSDEIGLLADEFDAMLGKLEQSRQEVVRNARLAGMSELSAGVLHNVGNVLNSVSVSASLARKQLKENDSSDLQAIVKGLEEHELDLETYLESDERGKHLLPFLAGLIRQHAERAQQAGAELESLDQGIGRMATLISSLQDYDSRIGVVERIDLGVQADAAIELALRSLDREVPVLVKREYQNLPRVRVDRHKLMEILVNLVLNAVQSMDAAGVEKPVMTVRIARQDDEMVRLEVSDIGTGIPEELMASIFSQGYSGREGGRGLGLHLSGTAAVEMGAKLNAKSDGVGHGATFSLVLPAETSLKGNSEESVILFTS